MYILHIYIYTITQATTFFMAMAVHIIQRLNRNDWYVENIDITGTLQRGIRKYLNTFFSTCSCRNYCRKY